MTIKTYNRFNFYRHTFCVFKEVTLTTIENKKEFNAILATSQPRANQRAKEIDALVSRGENAGRLAGGQAAVGDVCHWPFALKPRRQSAVLAPGGFHTLRTARGIFAPGEAKF